MHNLIYDWGSEPIEMQDGISNMKIISLKQNLLRIYL